MLSGSKNHVFTWKYNASSCAYNVHYIHMEINYNYSSFRTIDNKLLNSQASIRKPWKGMAICCRVERVTSVPVTDDHKTPWPEFGNQQNEIVSTPRGSGWHLFTSDKCPSHSSLLENNSSLSCMLNYNRLWILRDVLWIFNLGFVEKGMGTCTNKLKNILRTTTNTAAVFSIWKMSRVPFVDFHISNKGCIVLKKTQWRWESFLV